MISDTYTINIDYVSGPSTAIFSLLAVIVVIVILKWLIDVLP